MALVSPAPTLDAMPPRAGVSHWLVVPLGVLLSQLIVWVLGPLLVNFTMAGLAQALPAAATRTTMLALDTVLTGLGLWVSFLLAASSARRPRARVVSWIALIDFVILVAIRSWLGAYRPRTMLVWYEIAILGMIAVTWWFVWSSVSKRDRLS